MVKICDIIIGSLKIFLPYMKLKCLQKIGSVWFIYKKWLVISAIHKLFQYNFWWNFLEFRDIMDLTVDMKVFYNIKHCHSISLKFGGTFFTSLPVLGCEAKATICSAIRESLILSCHKFSAFFVTVIK